MTNVDLYRSEKEHKAQKRNKAADDILEYIKKQQLCYDDVEGIFDIIMKKIRHDIILD